MVVPCHWCKHDPEKLLGLGDAKFQPHKGSHGLTCWAHVHQCPASCLVAKGCGKGVMTVEKAAQNNYPMASTWQTRPPGVFLTLIHHQVLLLWCLQAAQVSAHLKPCLPQVCCRGLHFYLPNSHGRPHMRHYRALCMILGSKPTPWWYLTKPLQLKV